MRDNNDQLREFRFDKWIEENILTLKPNVIIIKSLNKHIGSLWMKILKFGFLECVPKEEFKIQNVCYLLRHEVVI